MNNFDVQPQDEAMEQFRKLFPVPLTNLSVSMDGTRMSYDLTLSERFWEYKALAETIVLTNALPLKISRCSFGFGIYLVLEFQGKKSELPCY